MHNVGTTCNLAGWTKALEPSGLAILQLEAMAERRTFSMKDAIYERPGTLG